MSADDRLRSAEGYARSFVNWDFLDDVWGIPGVRPSDIDGHVCINGYFLYVEVKGFTAELTEGQRYAIEQRVRDGVSTFVVAWGDRANTSFEPQHIRVYTKRVTKDYDTVNQGTLRDLCGRWSAYVRSQPPPDWGDS